MCRALLLGIAIMLALPAGRAEALGGLYGEALRPQFHFTAQQGWINDPNGLIFYRGEYHLFFQHDPSGLNNRSNKRWGHAISTDLVHWRELPAAILPDASGNIWSGSAVVDWRNSSGFGLEGRPAQVLIYTSAGATFGIGLATSNDGRTYAKYGGNPVVGQIMWGNRDPKVIWYAPGKEWVMALYVGPHRAIPDAIGRPAVTGANTIQFLSSTDLKHWTLRGRTPGFFECPNLFELPVDGDPARRKWVLTDASSDYMVGSFNGDRFAPETPKIRGHSGQHIAMYAAQVFSDLPSSDGRCIQMGWLNAPSPGMPFSQALTMPMELKLIGTPGGPRLSWAPAREMERLRGQSAGIAGPVRIGPGGPNPFAAFRAELVEVRAEFAPGSAERIAFTVRGVPVVYDARRQEIIVNHHAAAAPLWHGREDVAIYVDRTTVEVFASRGLTYVPVPLIPEAGDVSLAVAVEGGSAEFSHLEAYHLNSIWMEPKGKTL